jgi:hypothetical protein
MAKLIANFLAKALKEELGRSEEKVVSDISIKLSTINKAGQKA